MRFIIATRRGDAAAGHRPRAWEDGHAQAHFHRPIALDAHRALATRMNAWRWLMSSHVRNLRTRSPLPPPSLAASTDLFGHPYPTYRLFLIVVGFAACAALAVWLLKS
jgi:hypothetical protein